MIKIIARIGVGIVGLLIIGMGSIYVYHKYSDRNIQSINTVRQAQNETKSTSTSLLENRLIDEEKAISLVTALPEIKEVKDRLAKRNEILVIEGSGTGKVQYADDSNEPYWEVHVYEDKEDHQATLGWYRVYQASGRIESEF